MTKTLFDKIYEKTGEFLDAIKRPMVECNLKRKFQEAWDCATLKTQEADWLVDNYYIDTKIEELDLQKIVNIRLEWEHAKIVKWIIESEYTKLFNEEIK